MKKHLVTAVDNSIPRHSGSLFTKTMEPNGFGLREKHHATYIFAGTLSVPAGPALVPYNLELQTAETSLGS
jgi:hypothetical protein